MTESAKIQPKLDELLARYLNKQAGAMTEGTASFEPGAEVMPYEAGPVQPIDAQRAWQETQLVVRSFCEEVKGVPVPPNWPQLVASHEPVVAMACSIGNFPQLVRNFHQILQRADLASLRPGSGRAVAVPELVKWGTKASDGGKYPQVLLALGALRLAKQFEEADRLVASSDANIPDEWRAAWENEKAALAWHQGKADEARQMWEQQEPSAAVLFNRGMADLFLGNPAQAQQSLRQAAELLPNDGAWQHLAQLYLTLAQSRGADNDPEKE